MNLKKLGRTLGIIAAVAMLTLVLQGCGGDGVDEGLHEQVVMERDAALAAQAAAEAAQTAAEAAQTAAENARTAAEADKAAAEAAQAAAEAAQAAAEADKATAEADKVAAEAAQVAAEAAQAAAEAAQVAAEAARANELMAAQTAASTAAAAAQTASDNAAAAAQDAEDAGMNLATQQTGAMSATLAGEARASANKAMTEATAAQMASDEAADAMALASALAAKGKAEAAQEAAEGHETMADEKSTDSQSAAAMELMIDGMSYSVGGTSVMSDADSRSVTDDDQTTITGLIEAQNPMTTTADVAGVDGAADKEDEDRPITTAHMQAVAGRTLTIGKTLDSSDDMARLRLVTDYAGTKMVPVYSLGTMTYTGTKAGFVTVDDSDPATDDANNTPVDSEGMYYQAGANDGALTAGDQVGAETEAERVVSFDHGDEKKYAVLSSTLIEGETTTYTYTEVDVTVTIANADPEEVMVKASLPEATAYEHINFGVWAALSEADAAGMQDVASLGIGFVQSIGDGATGDDLPNNGSANYEGSWVAAVQAMDEDGDGDITLEDGDASLSADFSEGEITADLDSLAMLKGDISGNTFSGTKVSDIAHDALDDEGEFTGTFEGGFYGAKAAEAAGIFDFTSEGMEAGAFRGAFGGDRK